MVIVYITYIKEENSMQPYL